MNTQAVRRMPTTSTISKTSKIQGQISPSTVAEWMKNNRESIHGCGVSEVPQPEWGRITQKGKTVYVHIFDKPGYCLTVPGLNSESVDYGTYLSDNTEANLGNFWNGDVARKDVIIPMPSARLKDEIDTVVKIKLK